jgi:pimeloyl-ACP methyl ester carboxylesterase
MLPDLILLHGALGSESQLEKIKDALRDNFNLYSYNLSGHGGKPIPPKFSIQNFEEELINFLDSNSLNAVNVFGYSMGGYIALQVALNHPGRIARIMTLGTMLKWNPEIAANEVKMLNPEIIEAKVQRFAEQLKQTHAPEDWKLIMQRIVDMMIRMGNGDAMTTADFEKINIPVLVGLGSLDQMVKKEDALEMVEHLPKGEFRLFEGWKHPIEGVDVGELAGVIKKWNS